MLLVHFRMPLPSGGLIHDAFEVSESDWEELTADWPNRGPLTFFLSDEALEEDEPDVCISVGDALLHCTATKLGSDVRDVRDDGDRARRFGNVDFFAEIVESAKS